MDILGPKLGSMVFQFPLFDRWKFPKQDSAHTLPEEASYRSQICNRDSKQDLARCQIRGRAPGIQRRFGTD